MTITLETRTPCLLCGYLHRVIVVATVVISKRSMRTKGPMLGGYAYRTCPECGTPAGGNPFSAMPRRPYRVAPKDAVKVAEYRRRKWGVEDTGVNVERVVE